NKDDDVQARQRLSGQKKVFDPGIRIEDVAVSGSALRCVKPAIFIVEISGGVYNKSYIYVRKPLHLCKDFIRAAIEQISRQRTGVNRADGRISNLHEPASNVVACHSR